MKMSAPVIILIIYIIWNVVTFAQMGLDKLFAVKDKWRIRERTLLICAFLMGGVGSIIGSVVFHHKTKKAKFVIGLPLALIFNIAVAAGVIYLIMK